MKKDTFDKIVKATVLLNQAKEDEETRMENGSESWGETEAGQECSGNIETLDNVLQELENIVE